MSDSGLAGTSGSDAQAQRGGVTAHSYGSVDVTAAHEECWLVRLPIKLAELWDDAPEGTVLGDLIFRSKESTAASSRVGTAEPASKPSVTVVVSETFVESAIQRMNQKEASGKTPSSLTAATSIPLKYSMEAMTKKIPVMYPFHRNAEDGSCTIMGTVTRTANLQVDTTSDSNTKQYRNLLKDRLESTTVTSQRFVKPVTTTETILSKHRIAINNNALSGAQTASSSAPRSFGNAVLQYGKRKLEAASASNQNYSSDYRSLFEAGNDKNGSNEDDETQRDADGAGLAGVGSGASAHGGAGDPGADGSDSRATKKLRMFSGDQPLRSVLFALFGKQSYWAVKDIKAAAVAGGAIHAGTKKGEVEIRDILRDIGEYHRAGDHKNMWSLRSEFQV
jgi:TFIIF, beta subunit HTH domain/TFIIF, beta subunit N-terminus